MESLFGIYGLVEPAILVQILQVLWLRSLLSLRKFRGCGGFMMIGCNLWLAMMP